MLKKILKKKVVKNFLSLSIVDIALKPLLFVRGFIVAKYLGPEDYGLLKSIELIQKLNKFGNLGFLSVVRREAGNYIGEGDEAKLKLTKNTSYTSEAILALLLFLIGVGSTLFIDSKKITFLIIIASVGLCLAKLLSILRTEIAINKKFVIISKVTLASTLIANVVVIVAVPYLKIYAVVLTNVLLSVVAIILYKIISKFKFTFRLDVKEFLRILRIGIPLTFATLAQGSFEYSIRLLLLNFLGKAEVGFFAFASMISGQFLILLKTSIRVRMQDIYEGLGGGKYKLIHNMVVKETAIFTLASIVIIPFAWVLIGFLIPMYLKKWEPAILVFKVYLFSLPFLMVANYASVVVTSKKVNKQSLIPIIRFFVTGILIAFTLILLVLNNLTLLAFTILVIVCHILYALGNIVLYKIYFYDRFIKDNDV